MRIKRLRIKNFRSIKEAELFPQEHNALLGPNNAGKTTLLESLALVLNPELPVAGHVIDENDFYLREYSLLAGTASASAPETTEGPTVEGEEDASPSTRPPEIRIEAVLSDLSDEDEDAFRRNLVVWQEDNKTVVDAVDRGADPFANGQSAIRVVFEGWYDEAEDDFFHKTYFLPVETLDRDQCSTFTRDDKRRVGFLIYRDFRASNRPTTLEPNLIFGRLLQSQRVVPRHFDDVLSQVSGALAPMLSEPDFASIINSYKAELERFLYLSFTNPSSINFELTDRTRSQIKATAQLYVSDLIGLPLQKMGAGTRSLATLATLTLIMRRRGRGILALEEPESFLFPHAQRRIIDECLELADQTFVTTHSPYVIERLPLESIGRLDRHAGGELTYQRVPISTAKQAALYAKRLRSSIAEALLANAVIVVEGDSDRWWLTGCSRVLHGGQLGPHKHEAFDLQGIAVVSAETNGDVLKLGAFFGAAGLKVVGVVDKVTDASLLAQLCAADFPTIHLKQNGIERLLVEQLPANVISRIISEAPYSRTPLTPIPQLSSISESDQRTQCESMLKANKSSQFMHEWILSLLSPSEVPASFAFIVDVISRHVSFAQALGHLFLTS